MATLLLSACGGGNDNPPSNPVSCSGENCPIANAGLDQEVVLGSEVRLDGSQSSSGTANLLTYEWTLTEKPTGSTAVMDGATTVRPSFVADLAGTYTAKLVVHNGGTSSNPDTTAIKADTGNLPPIAIAGLDRTVPIGRPVVLSGTDSYDPNGMSVSYAWRVLTQPPESRAVLNNPSSSTPFFTPDQVGVYILALTVSDGTLASPSDIVEITVITGNVAPISDAGPNQHVLTGQRVTLTGGGSIDPNGDPLSYHWRFQSMPDNSTASLTDASTVSPSLRPDLAGFYVVCLSVNDGTNTSPCDTVVVETSIFNFASIDVPGQTEIIAIDGINDRGQVVGTFRSPPNNELGQHGFVKTRDAFRTINFPGAVITSANGINSAEQVIGSAATGLCCTGSVYGYSERNGTFTTLFQGTWDNRNVVSGVNTRGDIVGRTVRPTELPRGFLREANGQFTIIHVPEALLTNANGINAQGKIVGNYQTSNEPNAHGFLYNNGQFTTIDVPDARDTVPLAINSKDVVAGTLRDLVGQVSGYLYDRGTVTRIHVPEANRTTVTGINNAGEFVGLFEDRNGTTHGFIGQLDKVPRDLQ